MRHRNFGLMMLLLLSVTLCGCAQLKEKLVPKPKKEDVTARKYYPVRKYDVRPSLELYTKRYIYWKNWHRELLSVLTDANHKKTVTAIEQETSNLEDMQSMLVADKAEELQVIISELAEIEKIIKTQRVTYGNQVRMQKKLELIGKKIKKNFSYNKIRGFIGDDFRSKL